jgi:hypothetical protein
VGNDAVSQIPSGSLTVMLPELTAVTTVNGKDKLQPTKSPTFNMLTIEEAVTITPVPEV